MTNKRTVLLNVLFEKKVLTFSQKMQISFKSVLPQYLKIVPKRNLSFVSLITDGIVWFEGIFDRVLYLIIYYRPKVWFFTK